MNPDVSPDVLCVDDDERVLESFVLHLRKGYRVHTASSGEAGLRKLDEIGGAAVVVSDLRMPNMDGPTFLHRVMLKCPEASRILLAAEASRDFAAAAVNDGQIFRFLIKPCPPERLRAAIDAGIRQHQLATTERVILQETLMGSLRALADLLSMTNPHAFGRANRIKRLAMEIAAAAGHAAFWELEAAAMFSQLGYLSLPVDLVEKLYDGRQLSPEEQVRADLVPKDAARLLSHIPRIERVLGILNILDSDHEGAASHQDGRIVLGARILHMVIDFDLLISRGHDANVAVQAMQSRAGRYDADLLGLLAGSSGASKLSGEMREVKVGNLRPGMTLMVDLRTSSGMLLVPRGFEVSESFFEHMRRFPAAVREQTVPVLLVGAREAASPDASTG